MNKKISILHFSQVNGGVERYLKLFLQFSNKEKFNNSIISPQRDNYATHSELVNNFYEVDIDQSFSLAKLVKNILNIRQIILREKPDVLYLHSTFAGVIGRVAALGCKCKVVYNPHGWSFKMNVSLAKRLFYKLIETVLSFFTDKYILISQSEYDLAKQVCFNKENLTLIYNGIETSLPETKVLDIPINGRYTIGMVGRISEQKDPLFFIEFAKKIHQLKEDTFFILVGDGELRAEIENRIKEYGLQDNFMITGWVTNPQDYLAVFDQAVLFSKWEGLCLSVAEYMKFRKPILVTDIGGINDLIQDNMTGLLVEVGDLESAVKKSLILREDLSLSQRLGNSAYQKLLANFSVKKQMSEIELMFKKLLKDNI